MLNGSAGKQVTKLPDAHVFSIFMSVGKEVGIDNTTFFRQTSFVGFGWSVDCWRNAKIWLVGVSGDS